MGQERLWSSSKEAKSSKLVFFVGPTIHHKCHHCHNLWHYDIVMLCYIQSLFVQPWQVAWQGEHKHRFEETAMAVIFLVESSQARFQKNEKKKKQTECDPYPFGHKLNWKWYKDNVFNVLPHQPNGLLYLSAYCEFDAISNKLVQGQQQTGKVVEWPQITCLEQVSSCFYLLRWWLLSERHAILLLTA